MKKKFLKQARRTLLGRVLCEVVYVIQFVAGVIAVITVASLVPGDNQNLGTLAAIIGLVMLALADALVSVPLLALAYAKGRPAVKPVEPGSRW